MHYFVYISLSISLILAAETDISLNSKHGHKHGCRDLKHHSHGKDHQQKDKECRDDYLKDVGKIVAEANDNFVINIFKAIATDSKSTSHKNIFFSPISISTELLMLALGAKSKTQQQIMEALNLNQTQLSAIQIHNAYKDLIQKLNNNQCTIGNVIFADNKVNMEKYEENVKMYYQAVIIPINFRDPDQAREQLNDFVNITTKGKIKEMFQDLDSSTQMVLLNYVLYKGTWADTFQPSFTQENTFTVDANIKVHVPMMNRIGLYKTYRDKERSCNVIELPFKDKFVMLLVVPDLGKINEVDLTWEAISQWRKSVATSIVDLYMPKFSINSKLSLKDILPKMGISDIFSDRADFSGITEQVHIKVAKAMLYTVLDVNEFGTEAVATTSGQAIRTKIFKEFLIDRPFFLLIYSETLDSYLFMGKIINPKWN